MTIQSVSHSKRTFFDPNMKNPTILTASKNCDEFPQQDQHYKQSHNMAQLMIKYQVDLMNMQKVEKRDFDTLHWPCTTCNIQFDDELRWYIYTRALNYQSYARNASYLILTLWDIIFSLHPYISNKQRWVSSMALMQSNLRNQCTCHCIKISKISRIFKELKNMILPWSPDLVRYDWIKPLMNVISIYSVNTFCVKIAKYRHACWGKYWNIKNMVISFKCRVKRAIRFNPLWFVVLCTCNGDILASSNHALFLHVAR